MNIKSVLNYSSLEPLDNPKHCLNLFLKNSDFYQYAYSLKWNLIDTQDLIDKFYVSNDVNKFFKFAYLLYYVDGIDSAYEFIVNYGQFESVTSNNGLNIELLILLLKIFKEKGTTEQVDFILQLMQSHLTHTLPKTLGIPDIYTHASLHATIASAVQKSNGNSLYSKSNDIVLIDICDGQLELTNLANENLIPTEINSNDIYIIAMMRVRNEMDNIEIVIKSTSKYVDKIVIYDDCSTDDTVEVIKKCQENGLEIDLIEGKEWLFNESLIHQKIVERGRKLGGTHFIQMDADEILSISLTPKIFRQLMANMKPGDVLALPWLNVNEDITGYYSEEKIVGLSPSRSLKRYKDIAFADDGFTQFAEWQYAHVNTAPFVYTRRFLSLNDEISLLHLEQINLINFISKKDWYRIRAYDQNKKLPSDPYTDIRLLLLQLDDIIKFFDVNVCDNSGETIDIFKKLSMSKINSNLEGYKIYPEISKNLYLKYDMFSEKFNNLSEG